MYKKYKMRDCGCGMKFTGGGKRKTRRSTRKVRKGSKVRKSKKGTRKH